jgi:hypothetical protein
MEDHPWGTPLRTPLVGPWGNPLGGPPMGDHHDGHPLDDPPWLTTLLDPVKDPPFGTPLE